LLTQSFRPHFGPGVDSASNRNEHQEYFLGGKAGRYVRLPTFTTFMCRLSWNLGASTSCNPQGLSRPVMEQLNPKEYGQKSNRQPTTIFTDWSYCATCFGPQCHHYTQKL